MRFPVRFTAAWRWHGGSIRFGVTGHICQHLGGAGLLHPCFLIHAAAKRNRADDHIAQTEDNSEKRFRFYGIGQQHK